MVAQGVTGTVIDRGSVKTLIPYLLQSIRHGMQDAGIRSIAEAHRFLEDGQLRFEIRSPAAVKEGGIHGLHTYEGLSMEKRS